LRREWRTGDLRRDIRTVLYNRGLAAATDAISNVVYLAPKKATSGGFYPHGVNGQLNTSS
jgi:hypothetical protein